MSKIDDGGPAFPKTKTAGIDTQLQDGMSLRDWFAGQAMTALLSTEANEAAEPESIARWAYEQADAMIAARKTGASE